MIADFRLWLVSAGHVGLKVRLTVRHVFAGFSLFFLFVFGLDIGCGYVFAPTRISMSTRAYQELRAYLSCQAISSPLVSGLFLCLWRLVLVLS